MVVQSVRQSTALACFDVWVCCLLFLLWLLSAGVDGSLSNDVASSHIGLAEWLTRGSGRRARAVAAFFLASFAQDPREARVGGWEDTNVLPSLSISSLAPAAKGAKAPSILFYYGSAHIDEPPAAALLLLLNKCSAKMGDSGFGPFSLPKLT